MIAMLLLACAGDPAETPTDTTPAAPSETAADTAAPTPGAPLDLSAWVDDGEGVWVGTARDTPLGDLPFAIAMERQDDGSLLGVADNGYGFTLSFHYAQQPDGRWTLTEAGTLPGGFEQRWTLEARSLDGDRVEWITPDDPDYLVVVVDHTGDSLILEALVRGERHAVLDLARSDR